MRLWVINLKKKKKKETTRTVSMLLDSNIKMLFKKGTYQLNQKYLENSAFKALQSPLPIASLSPIPTTEEIVAEYGNIINIYLYKDLLTLEIYLKSN